MDCVIKNNKNVYIRLNSNGTPVSCNKHDASVFEYNKAKNILNSLPRTLKKFHFHISYISEKINNTDNQSIVIHKEFLDNTDNEHITRWVDKFGICQDIIDEAKNRLEELGKLLSNVDKEISNELHLIELEKDKNAYEGYLFYKTIRDVLRKRRKLKDEQLVLYAIIKMNFRNFDSEIIKKTVDGLAKRKFTMRVIDNEDNDDSDELW